MADAIDKAAAAQGATADDLNDGQGLSGAPKAPDVSNAKPKPEGLDEELGADGKPKAKEPTAEEKAAAEAKVASDKAAAEEAEKAAAEAAKAVEVKEYIVLEDAAGQAAIDLLKEGGVSPTDANAIFAKAIESGDLADVNVAELEAKLGKAKATLVMAGVTDYYTRIQAQNDASREAVYEILGGEDNWNTVREWAKTKEKSDPKFKTRLAQTREMLDKGGLYAEAAGRELRRAYEADPATKGLGNNVPLERGDGLKNSHGTPMSRAEYMKAMHEANERGAPKSETNALWARRKAGKDAGL